MAAVHVVLTLTTEATNALRAPIYQVPWIAAEIVSPVSSFVTLRVPRLPLRSVRRTGGRHPNACHRSVLIIRHHQAASVCKQQELALLFDIIEHCFFRHRMHSGRDFCEAKL